MTSNWEMLFLAPHEPDPRSPGHYRYCGPVGIPQDLDWDSLDRLCPVTPLPDPYGDLLAPEHIAEARAELKRGLTPPFHDALAIRLGQLLRDVVSAQCPEQAEGKAGRLYVLEFQGPFQYVLFGQTAKVWERISRHILDAGRHGFGLLNAWASPVLPHAQKQERLALHLAEGLHNAQHEGERFYEMPFDTALTVVRVAAENGLLKDAASNANALEHIPSSNPARPSLRGQ